MVRVEKIFLAWGETDIPCDECEKLILVGTHYIKIELAWGEPLYVHSGCGWLLTERIKALVDGEM